MRRRVFYAAGVNHIWAFDQHDKWQRYGLRHHIGVEPFTGRILWLIIWWNNSDPKVPARQYFKAIRETGGTKISRPYTISKTIQENPLSERKCRSYRRVKPLSFFPLAWGGVLPFPAVGCGRWGVPTGFPFG